MRQLATIGFIFALIVNGDAFAADPVQGIYLGLMGEISHANNLQFNVTLNQVPYSGQINLEPVGGGAGASLGYKIQTFRLEAELLFNINSYDTLQIGSCTLVSPNVVGPRGTCSDFANDNGLAFKGNSTGVYGLFNVFYDFLSSNPDNNLVPFIGVGIGMGQIKNTVQIQNNKYSPSGYIPVSVNANTTQSGAAIQGILGINYYIDDFVTIGMDYRYLSTAKTGNSSSNNNQFAVSTLNFTGNFALDKGK